MARVRLCVCGSWFVGREGQAAHPRAPGQCLHFECRGAPARVRAWRCEGRPPLPHHFVCVEKFTLPYLTLAAPSPGSETLDVGGWQVVVTGGHAVLPEGMSTCRMSMRRASTAPLSLSLFLLLSRLGRLPAQPRLHRQLRLRWLLIPRRHQPS